MNIVSRLISMFAVKHPLFEFVMNIHLTKLFQDGDPEKLISYVDDLDQDGFSLITFIDSLSPLHQPLRCS
jgi:hypothetical protein